MVAFCVFIVLGVGATILSVQVFQEWSDEELLAHYNQGHMRAFECLYQRHRKPVFNFILRSVGSPQRAEELVQEVFLKIIQNASGYVREAKFTTWLYTIARNRCIDEFRRSKIRKEESLQRPVGKTQDGSESTLEHFLEDPVATQAGMSRAFGSQIQDALQTALATLPELQREVFLLREVSQLSFQEIAEVIGVSENTAKSRMRYALEKLRHELEMMGFSAEDLNE